MGVIYLSYLQASRKQSDNSYQQPKRMKNMICPYCGASFPQNFNICPNCQAVQTPPPPPMSMGQNQVPNYLVQSILVTLCCCMPLGIVAIIFSAQVNNALAIGNFAGAQEASRKAKMWCIIALACGLVSNALGIILQIFLTIAQM